MFYYYYYYYYYYYHHHHQIRVSPYTIHNTLSEIDQWYEKLEFLDDSLG